MKISSIILAIVLCLSLLTGCGKQPERYEHKPELEFASEAVFVIDANTGDILYEKNADKGDLPPIRWFKFLRL